MSSASNSNKAQYESTVVVDLLSLGRGRRVLLAPRLSSSTSRGLGHAKTDHSRISRPAGRWHSYTRLPVCAEDEQRKTNVCTCQHTLSQRAPLRARILSLSPARSPRGTHDTVLKGRARWKAKLCNTHSWAYSLLRRHSRGTACSP